MFLVIFNLLLHSVQTFAQESVVNPATNVVAQAPQQAPVWMQFVPFIVIVGVFYFFLIRPQAKKQKETATFLSGLKNGDLIITQSGVLGRITGLTDLIATLEVAPEVHIKVLRAQIAMPQSILQAKKEGK